MQCCRHPRGPGTEVHGVHSVYVTTCPGGQKAMRPRLHDHRSRATAFPPFPSSHPSCPALSRRSQDSQRHCCGFVTETSHCLRLPRLLQAEVLVFAQ